MSRLRWLPNALLAWLIFAASAGALEVKQTLWGFDGRVVPGRMNPLSILFANPAGAPFDRDVLLHESNGIGGQTGATYAASAYIAPGTERWVQFQVFVGTSNGGFSLSWGKGKDDSLSLDAPTLGPPARVILTDPENPFSSAGSFKLFPDALFPATVAATDALDSVVLDYTPRWEVARREALIDWVKRGGLVMIVHGSGGEFPVFSEQLDALNTAGDSAHLGAGTVLRVPVTRREVSEKLFADRGYPAPQLQQKKQDIVVYNLEQSLFEQLARLTRPDIRWWLINLLTIAYVLIIGPAHYRWGRRIDYRLSILVFLGTVVVFAWAFAVVGRRGYGETQTVHSLAIARPLGGGRHDVMQWISAFATKGDVYALTHRAPANLYAAPSTEAINGRIFNGKDGRFLADIPLYSSRQFVHRATMTGDDTSVTVEAWETSGDALRTLTLKVGPQFPKRASELSVKFRNRYYSLDQNGDLLTLAKNSPRTFTEFLPQEKVQSAMQRTFNTPSRNANDPARTASEELDSALRSTLPLLYARAADGKDYFQQEITRAEPPGDQLQLYIAAPSPEGFDLQGKGFGRESSYVLYVQKVFKP